jgi:BCD family chlorophyll transporter-like MFS transporter
MSIGNFIDPQIDSSPVPKLNLLMMFRLGLLQMELGMMSVLIFGVMKLLYRGVT